MNGKTTMFAMVWATAATVAGWVANGSESAGGRPLPVVDVSAGDFHFRAPDTVTAGLTRIRLSNDGREIHHLQLVRLVWERSLTELALAMGGDDLFLPGVEYVGGPAEPLPGDTTEAIVRLEPGHYALVCLISARDHVRHLSKGMIRPLEVVGPSAPAGRVRPPAADLVIGLDDYSFELSKPLTEGKAMVRVENRGPQPHEVTIWRLDDGVTEAEARAWLEHPNGPPPATPVGGTSLIAPGGLNLVPMDVPSGTLMLLCFMPDPKDHRSHLRHGMLRFVTVP